MENFREWLMPFWFVCFSLAGIAGTAIFLALTTGISSLSTVVTTGSIIGIVLGGTAALVLYYFQNRHQQP